jgi:DNA-directed RNA polymerase subunit M/transcription elongation factor TFIIS
MDEERIIGKKIFSEFINKKCSNEIEQILYGYSENNKNTYMIKLKYLFELINPKSKIYNKTIVDKIKKKKLSYNDLIYFKPWELCSEQWKLIIEEQNKTDKIVMDKTPTFTTTKFTCSKCKNNECKTYSLQTRSADEPTTIFVNCIKCDNTWKM